MASYKTMLDDPITATKQRSVYRIPQLKVNTKKIRLLDYKLIRTDAGGAEVPYYFGSGGSAEIIKKISINSLDGVEIDRVGGYGLYVQNLQNARIPNAQQYGVSSILTKNQDLSVLTPTFGEVTNGTVPLNGGELSAVWNANKSYQQINISTLLQYLQVARSVSDDGFEVVIEWNFSAMEADGTKYTFTQQPKIAYDVYLDDTPVDSVPASGFVYYSMVPESIPILPLQPLEIIDRKLTSFNKQTLNNVYYFLKNGEELSGKAPELATIHAGKWMSETPKLESAQLIIDGISLFAKKSISKPAHKQSILNDQFGICNIPAGSNTDLVAPLGLSTDGRFSYGVFPVQRFVSDELILQYAEAKAHARASAVVLVGEVLRGYIPSKALTYYVETQGLTSEMTIS
jgi:hypothetical protein